MPTIPFKEPDEEEPENEWLVAARKAASAAARAVGADPRVTARQIIALIIVVTICALNPTPAEAVAGVIASMYLALEVARK